MSCRMVSAPPSSTTRPTTHLDRLLLDQRRDEARVLGDGAVMGVFLCEVAFARGLAVCFGGCERHLVHVLGLLFLPVRRISDRAAHGTLWRCRVADLLVAHSLEPRDERAHVGLFGWSEHGL